MLARRVLGNTGLAVTELGFGAMNLRLVKPPRALETLAFVLRAGINFIDSSETYNRKFPDGTRSENEAHKLIHGTRYMGERFWSARLKERDVRVVRWLLLRGWAASKIARLYSVHRDTIWNISAGKTWKHVA